uniref:Helix-loop-helix DNA-binding domain containing protein n=1 Tax=Aegilops tauschii TaxID=37682 RepID=A0A336UT49_AEGTA|nr:helix-loop-helix DNA-binding domain containing protein [Aegilops tauschii]
MDRQVPATDPWWHPDYYPGEAATAGGGDDFLDMFVDSSMHACLLGLAWEGGTALPCVRSPPPALGPPCASPPEPTPSEDVMAAWLYPILSGEDNAGDGPMVKSEPSAKASGSLGMTESEGKLPATDGMDHVKEETAKGRKELAEEGYPIIYLRGVRADTNIITSDSSERRKAASGGSNRARSSRHSDTQNDTEKRRRCKISDRLRTLQQLVPGCKKVSSYSVCDIYCNQQSPTDCYACAYATLQSNSSKPSLIELKLQASNDTSLSSLNESDGHFSAQSNHASTLEQTIQYMKSLQQHVQAMNVRPAQAVYPVMQTASVPAVAVPLGAPSASAAPGTVVAGGCVPLLPAGMAPFGAMFPYPPYHAVMMPAQSFPILPPIAGSLCCPRVAVLVSTEQHYRRGQGGRGRL